LGATTGTFDHKGDRKTGPTGVNLKFPRYQFTYAMNVGDGLARAAGFGGTIPEYSASFKPVKNQQDYDIQTLLSASSATDTTLPYYGKVLNKRINIRKVFFKTPRAMWRFYGYYGGFSVVGNMRTYGQYADDSTFEIVPTWQNKLQAMAYEDALYTRVSHYSYEIIDNKLRLYPIPSSVPPDKFWFRFTIETNSPFTDNVDSGQNGVNNMNTLPFQNIPYESINSIGKQWIRRFSLALSKETLGQIRGKFGGSIPIPGDNITLNSSDLLSQAKDEQTSLKEELRKLLDETTYDKLIETDKNMVENQNAIIKNAPLGIFVG